MPAHLLDNRQLTPATPLETAQAEALDIIKEFIEK